MATTSTSAVEEWKTPADARRRGAETKVRFARYCPPESPMSKPGEFVVRCERVVVCFEIDFFVFESLDAFG